MIAPDFKRCVGVVRLNCLEVRFDEMVAWERTVQVIGLSTLDLEGEELIDGAIENLLRRWKPECVHSTECKSEEKSGGDIANSIRGYSGMEPIFPFRYFHPDYVRGDVRRNEQDRTACEVICVHNENRGLIWQRFGRILGDARFLKENIVRDLRIELRSWFDFGTTSALEQDSGNENGAKAETLHDDGGGIIPDLLAAVLS